MEFFSGHYFFQEVENAVFSPSFGFLALVFLLAIRFLTLLYQNIRKIQSSILELKHLLDISNERLKHMAEVEDFYALKERIVVLESQLQKRRVA